MGVESNEFVLVTTRSWANGFDNVLKFIEDQPEHLRQLFHVSDVLMNSVIHIILMPNGSKKGWPNDYECANLRFNFIKLLEGYAYDDGSNPYTWVEVSYGEYGQNVLQGNNKNVENYFPNASTFPSDFFIKYGDGASDSTMYGVKLEDLTREELMACLAYTYKCKSDYEWLLDKQ